MKLLRYCQGFIIGWRYEGLCLKWSILCFQAQLQHLDHTETAQHTAEITACSTNGYPPPFAHTHTGLQGTICAGRPGDGWQGAKPQVQREMSSTIMVIAGDKWRAQGKVTQGCCSSNRLVSLPFLSPLEDTMPCPCCSAALQTGEAVTYHCV